jgi:isoleucyl-tRNA synthetase
MEALLAARAIVAQSIEQVRQQKLIGNSLEAFVDLALPSDNRVHQINAIDVEEFLILSYLNISVTDGEAKATVTKTSHPRCDRCWRHRPTVGIEPEHPTLCDRCADVVSQLATNK